MNKQLNTTVLEKRVKFLTIFVISLTIFIILTVVSVFAKIGSENFDAIVVKKLILVDSTGTKRIEMTTDLSRAPFAGEELERNVPPNMAAIIFMNPDGDEVGGIGFGGDENTKFALNGLDYAGIPLEAIGFNRVQTAKTSSAQLVVMDNPRKDSGFDAQKFVKEFNTGDWKDGKKGEQLKIFQEQMVPRVNLGVENHNASLVLMDKQGNKRIVLEVNEKNEAIFKILDEKGNIVQEFPQS